MIYRLVSSTRLATIDDDKRTISIRPIDPETADNIAIGHGRVNERQLDLNVAMLRDDLGRPYTVLPATRAV